MRVLLPLALLATFAACKPAADPAPAEMLEKLPERLQDLVARSMALQAKIRRLDATIHAPPTGQRAIGNPLVPQINLLKAAFEQ